MRGSALRPEWSFFFLKRKKAGMEGGNKRPKNMIEIAKLRSQGQKTMI